MTRAIYTEPPLTTIKKMQNKLFAESKHMLIVTELFNTVATDFYAKKSAYYS